MSEQVAIERVRAQERRRKQWMRLGVTIITGMLLAFAWIWIFTQPLPDGNKEVAITLAGAMTGSYGTIVSFYFGNNDKAREDQ